MRMIKSSSNPDAMMLSLLQSNPAYSQVMSLISQHNGDARAAFYDLAKQKGIDPNSVLNMLK